MATISLYASKINNMPGLIKDVKKSVTNYKSELSNLKNKSYNVNKSICNLDEVISTISTSTQTQEDKIEALETFHNNCEQFITDTVKIDSDVADIVNQNKDDFYNKYYYLKPDSEKNGWEKFCDGCKSVGEWCKEHWKIIATLALVVAAIVLICTGVGGPLAAIILGACKGLIIGAITGGLIGGLSSVASGGSFFEGFEDGAFFGALTGILFGGLGSAGQVLGSSCKVLSALGSVVKAIPVISKVSGVISLGMAGFDLLSLGIGLFDSNNPLVKFNQKLHSSKLYNTFQFGISVLAVLTAGFTQGMKNPTCFVAGTMILTANGLVAIENIKVGDKVISTNSDTFEIAEKAVIETYIRETTELLHLIINGEQIKTTVDHPFYVKDIGFVSAGDLYVGDKLLDSKGNTLLVEDRKIEILNEPVKVYNFHVEDFHTYHVGVNGILVHNECKGIILPKVEKDIIKKLGKDGLKKFQNAMKKYANRTGDNGIKLLSGKGIDGYMYEVKILGKGGAFRLLGKSVGKDEFIWEVFKKTHR